MRLGGVLVGLAPASMLVSCALFTSLDGYATSDASADAQAGDEQPVSSEAGAREPDAAGGGEASTEDASPKPFCATYPSALACTTFDGPTVGAGFEVTMTPDATLAFWTADFVSPPTSMLATLGPSTSSSNEASGAIRTPLSTPQSRWHARFAFRVVAAATNTANGLEIFSIDMTSGQLEQQVTIVVESTKRIFVDEWSPSPSVFAHHEIGVLSDGWHTLDVTVALTAVGSGTVTTVLDGKLATTPIQPNMATAARSDVNLGTPYARGIHDGWIVAFDDYMVETP